MGVSSPWGFEDLDRISKCGGQMFFFVYRICITSWSHGVSMVWACHSCVPSRPHIKNFKSGGSQTYPELFAELVRYGDRSNENILGHQARHSLFYRAPALDLLIIGWLKENIPWKIHSNITYINSSKWQLKTIANLINLSFRGAPAGKFE